MHTVFSRLQEASSSPQFPSKKTASKQRSNFLSSIIMLSTSRTKNRTQAAPAVLGLFPLHRRRFCWSPRLIRRTRRKKKKKKRKWEILGMMLIILRTIVKLVVVIKSSLCTFPIPFMKTWKTDSVELTLLHLKLLTLLLQGWKCRDRDPGRGRVLQGKMRLTSHHH